MTTIIIIASAVVILSTLYDSWLTLKTNLSPVDEMNPLARWVLRLVSLKQFVALKGIGAAVTVATFWGLSMYDPDMALAVAIPVSGLMAWLVWFLWHNS